MTEDKNNNKDRSPLPPRMSRRKLLKMGMITGGGIAAASMGGGYMLKDIINEWAKDPIVLPPPPPLPDHSFVSREFAEAEKRLKVAVDNFTEELLAVEVDYSILLELKNGLTLQLTPDCDAKTGACHIATNKNPDKQYHLHTLPKLIKACGDLEIMHNYYKDRFKLKETPDYQTIAKMVLIRYNWKDAETYLTYEKGLAETLKTLTHKAYLIPSTDEKGKPVERETRVKLPIPLGGLTLQPDLELKIANPAPLKDPAPSAERIKASRAGIGSLPDL